MYSSTNAFDPRVQICRTGWIVHSKRHSVSKNEDSVALLLPAREVLAPLVQHAAAEQRVEPVTAPVRGLAQDVQMRLALPIGILGREQVLQERAGRFHDAQHEHRPVPRQVRLVDWAEGHQQLRRFHRGGLEVGAGEGGNPVERCGGGGVRKGWYSGMGVLSWFAW
jgi:hypothetical protein